MIKFNTKSKDAISVSAAVLFLFSGLAYGANLEDEHVEKSRAPVFDLSAGPALNAQTDVVPQQKSADIFQRGFNNFASIDQNPLKGSDNYASIEQSDTSANNHAVIIQAGTYNQATVTQRGMASTGHIYQMGHSNRALVNQH